MGIIEFIFRAACVFFAVAAVLYMLTIGMLQILGVELI